MFEKFVAKTAIGPAAGGVIDANTEILTIDVSDLTNVTIHAVQLVDAGTTTQVIEATLDGTNFVQVGAALTEASWAAPAGNNASVERALSDANGMPLAYLQVRLRATALAGGGSYGLVAAGRQRGIR